MATKYISALTGPQMDKALLDMNNHISEAWAVGERDGVPVTMSDETYNNNAKFYSDRSAHYADIASRANIPTGDPAVRYDLEQQLTESEKLQARTNIGANFSNPNLLDNPFFTINQRKATSANNGYGVDRWRGNYDVNADGSITIRQFALQYADYPLNVPITMSAIYGDDNAVISGTLTLTDTTTQKYFATNGSIIQLVRNSSNAFMVWAGSTCKVKAVKIELGSVSTLANDSAPNYATELAKCIRKYQRFYGNSAILATGMCFSADRAQLQMPLLSQMDKNGTITLHGTAYLVGGSFIGSNGKTFTDANISYRNAMLGTNSALLQVNVGSGLTIGQAVQIQLRDATSYFEIVAED